MNFKNVLPALMLLPVMSFAQDVAPTTFGKIILVDHANKKVASSKQYTVTGDVIMHIDDTKIKCDSAVIDQKNMLVSAYGNVVMSANPCVQVFVQSLNVDMSVYNKVVYTNQKIN